MMVRTYQKLALVIPTLNEAENIKTVLDRAIAAMQRAGLSWEILVVDDESGDGTGDIVRHYAEADPRIRLLVRPGQRGLAGAITYGWAQSDGDLIGVMDADLQHPPELLPLLIQEVCNEFDIAIASRYLRRGSMDGWNPARKALSRLGVLASKPVQPSTLKIKDPLSGFFVLRRECIVGLTFQNTGFKLLLEILAKGRIQSAKEIPFKFATRQGGNSKANVMTAIHYVWLLCKLSSRTLSRHPRGEWKVSSDKARAHPEKP
jgi:dolichol-phosphate mannosyltransferase